MGKQPAFFMSKWEIFQKEHPEKFERKKRPACGGRPKAKKIYDCDTCGLHRRCRTPKMERFGDGRKKILIIGQCPGRVEDRKGKPLVGPSGRLLKRMFEYVGIDMDADCWRQNIVQCYPGQNDRGEDKEPTKEQYKCCSERILKDIEETQPKLIICLGGPAINAILKTLNMKGFTAGQMHGKVVPFHEFNCWVGCSYHPAFFRYRSQKKDKYPDDEIILGYDLANIISYLDQPLPRPLSREGNRHLTNVDEAVEFIKNLIRENKPTAYDYEATELFPWLETADLLTISAANHVDYGGVIPLKLSNDNGTAIFSRREQEVILDAWREFLRSRVPKVVQNINMEEIWGRMFLDQPADNIIHDTMIAAHVINNNSNTTGLGFQALMLAGHSYKGMVDVKNISSEPLDKVCNYNCFDGRYTLMSYYDQKAFFEANPGVGEFYKFYLEGAKELVSMRERGNRIDLDVLKELEDKYLSERELRISEMKALSGVRQYEEENEKEFNPDSSPQVAAILKNTYKIDPTKNRKLPKIKNKKLCTDKNALPIIMEVTDNEEVRTLINALLRFRKTCSLTERATNYRNVMDKYGYVHPSYNLNMADTYRSSADSPNIQNVFKHDKELLIFRKCIVPSIGRIMPEVDYSGMEVKGIAMFSGDPELIRQIREGKKWDEEHPEGGHNPFDTHWRWTSKMYRKPVEDVTKDQRYGIKNGFVFPSFYGSKDTSIVRSFPDLSPDHVKQVQKEFWEEYHYVKEWQNKMIRDYMQDGYVEAVNGWRRIGPLSINQLYNNLIQGVSFHLLLDALIRVGAEFRKRKLKSFANMEVHDSMAFDAIIEEVDELINIVTEIMCSERYEWQRGIPLSVEWEIGWNWYEMKPISIREDKKYVCLKDERIELDNFMVAAS